MRSKYHVFIIVFLVFSVLFLSGCKKEKQGIDVMTMHTVTYFVEGEQYGRSYIVSGSCAKPIDGPIVEGRKFLFWGIRGSETPFDFNKAITGNIELLAYFEEAPTLIVTNHIDSSKLSSESFKVSMDLFEDSNKSNINVVPGTTGSCYFYLTNSFNFDLTFKLDVKEEDVVKISVAYFFREVNGEPVTSIWKNISELKEIEITIPANSRKLFSLDWVWKIDSNETGDTDLGNTMSDVSISFTYYDFKKAE